MTPATASRTPVDTAREIFTEVLNRRDPDAVAEYWAEDVHEVFPTGAVHGRRAMRDYFADVFAAIPDFHIEPDRIAGEGETVFVKWHLSGTFNGAPWFGIEPTGSRIELDGMDCFTVRDGLIAANFVVYDQMSFARQIGMLPAQDSGPDRAMRRGFNGLTALRSRLRNR